ncbi:MAG TPA: GNAT family N-acetyltransferase [Acidimicrobiales bacterium]
MPDSGAEIAFRFASVDDVDAVVRLVESAYRGDSSRAGWTTEADLLDGQRTDAEQVGDMVRRTGSVIVLAERHAALCGCCHLEHVRSDRARFGMFAVRPELQGAGVGRLLLSEACRLAASWGAERLEMAVIKQRTDLIAWYRRLGFNPTGRTEPFPYGDDRFGRPRQLGLEFLVLEGECVGMAQRASPEL